MGCMRYVVTGGTGFIGGRVVSRLLDTQPDAQVWVLVRRQSLGRFERRAVQWGERVKPLVGELPELVLTDETIVELGGIDHVVHCAAIYDITAGEAEQRAANVDGTRAVIELARRLDATLHHVSSIAVAGDFAGEYTEDDFDVGQQLPTPYHQTKFEAEMLVRSTPGLRYRIYRPAVVVGDSRTGEMDKIDGPYYFFGVLAKLAVLPSFTPMLLPDTGRTNIVPVDYVSDALVALMHAAGSGRADVPPDRAENHRAARHLPRHRRRGRAAPAARVAAPLGGGAGAQGARARQGAAQHGGHPAGNSRRDFRRRRPGPHLRCRRDPKGIAEHRNSEVPEFASYAPKLWRYWAEHLDPDRARRDDAGGPLVGRHVIITGASSGIGRASAIAVAERGATVFALARNADALDKLVAEIRANGGQAYAFTCDVTDSTSVEHTVKDILGRFDHVDYLVNNAGRSIRRSVINSTDRLHDYERVMAVNYFGAVRMVLALLPHWRERRFGHVVNVSSAGVQARNPKYSSYLAHQGGAGRVRRRGRVRDAVRPHHVHQHPYATGQNADDRAVPSTQPGAGDQPRARRGNGGARARGEAGADRHPDGHARRGRQLLRAQDCRGGFCISSIWATPIRLRRAGFHLQTRPRPRKSTLARCVGGRSVRPVPSLAWGFPNRSNGWCGWCPACTGSPDYFSHVN